MNQVSRHCSLSLMENKKHSPQYIQHLFSVGRNWKITFLGLPSEHHLLQFLHSLPLADGLYEMWEQKDNISILNNAWDECLPSLPQKANERLPSLEVRWLDSEFYFCSSLSCCQTLNKSLKLSVLVGLNLLLFKSILKLLSISMGAQLVQSWACLKFLL